MTTDSLVGQLIELDRVCCLIYEHNPKWSQLKYLLLMPEDLGRNRKVRADIDSSASTFMGRDGEPHKAKIFRIQDLMQTPAASTDATANSHKLFTAAYIYYNVQNYELAEKCVAASFALNASSKGDDRVMEFVREVFKTKMKLQLSSEQAPPAVIRGALSLTAGSTEDIVQCLQTAELLRERNLFNDAVVVSNHAMKLLHDTMEEKKRCLQGQQKAVTFERQLSKALKDAHKLCGNLQVDAARHCDAASEGLMVIKHYCDEFNTTLIREFESFGVQCFSPVHGQSIEKSAHIASHFWAAHALASTNQFDHVTPHVISIFKCILEETVSLENFKNLVYDFIGLLKPFINGIKKHSDNAHGDKNDMLRIGVKSMFEGILSEANLSDIQKSTLLCLTASELMRLGCLLPLAQEHLQQSSALLDKVISACNSAGSGDKKSPLNKEESFEEDELLLQREASFEEETYECCGVETSSSCGGLAEAMRMKTTCDKTVQKVTSLQMSECFTNLSMKAITCSNLDDVINLIREEASQKFTSACTVPHEGVDGSFAAAEKLLCISESLYASKEAQHSDEDNASFRRRQECLNKVSFEFSKRAQGILENLENVSASKDPTPPALSREQARIKKEALYTAKRHMEKCNSSLVSGYDIMSVLSGNDNSFICYAVVMPREWHGVEVMAGVDLTILGEEGSMSGDATGEYKVIKGAQIDMINNQLHVDMRASGKQPLSFMVEFVDFKVQLESLLSDRGKNDDALMALFSTVISFYMGVKRPWDVYEWSEKGRELVSNFNQALKLSSGRVLDSAQVLADAIRFKVENDCIDEALSLLNIGPPPPPHEGVTDAQGLIDKEDKSIGEKESLLTSASQWLNDADQLVRVNLADAARAYASSALDVFLALQDWEHVRKACDVIDDICTQKLKELENSRSSRDQTIVESRIRHLQELAGISVKLSRLISAASKQGISSNAGTGSQLPTEADAQYYHLRAAHQWSALEKVFSDGADRRHHSDEEAVFLEAMVVARDEGLRVMLNDDELPVAQLANQYGPLYFAEAVSQVCQNHKLVLFAFRLNKASFDSVAKSLLQTSDANEKKASFGGERKVNVMSESNVLRGIVDPALKPISRSINVFVSSTFTDTVIEYDVLLALLPELEKLAAEQQIEFAISTMRWGVTDAAFDDNLTSFLCMQEIRRCAEVTCEGSICFLSLYNTKLGYRPPPLDIPTSEYELICEELSASTDAAHQDCLALIQRWYILDTNRVPPVYRLQPKSALLDDANKWWTIEPVLVGGLRKAVDVLSCAAAGDTREVKMTPDRCRVYHQSVTEEEIQVGLEQAEMSRARAFLFTRDITDIDAHLDDKAAARFVDMEYGTQSRDAVAHARIQAVTSTGGLLDHLLPPSHVHRQSVSWDVVAGVDQGGQEAYISQLSNEMRKMFETNIAASAALLSSHPASPSYHEALQHACIALGHRRNFVGRTSELEIVTKYLSGKATSNRRVLVVVGDVGVGKSSFFANVAMQAFSAHMVPTNSFVIIRFCGMTSLSSSLLDVLRSILCQLLRARGGVESSVATTFEQLSRSFLLELEVLATAEAPVIIFLDGLDQLQADVAQTQWLHVLLTQEYLPPHVYIIASTLRDENSNILTDWSPASIEGFGNISLPALSTDELSSLVTVTLQNEHRDLTAFQKIELMEAVSVDCTPLSFSVAWIAAKSWSSSMSQDLTSLSREGAAGLIEAFLQSMERKYDSPGHSLIGKLTTIIALSHSGASRFELENQVGHDRPLMEVLQKWWKLPTATKMPPGLLPRITAEFGSSILHESNAGGSTVLCFMNSLFETVVLKRYISSAEQERDAREAIVAYFIDNACPVALERRVVVVVDQLIRLKAFDRAREFILQKDIFYGYAVKEAQRTWLLGVLRVTGGYDGLIEAIRSQLDEVTSDVPVERTEGASETIVSSSGLARAAQCTTLAELFLDMELLEEAWKVSCEAVQLLEADIPAHICAEAYDSSTIQSDEALKHIAAPDTAPVLGPPVADMPDVWRQRYAEANEAKIRSGSLYYDVLESSPEQYKAVATSVLILSRRVLEIWGDNKATKGYGVALSLAGRMSYKQNIIGPIFIDRAIDLLNEAVTVLVDACGELSVEVGTALYWLGEAYLDKAVHTMGMFQRHPLKTEMSIALSCLFSAERILKISLGSVHKSVGQVLSTLGVAFCKCGQLQRSEQYFRLSTKNIEVATGVDSVSTATALLGLTGVLTMQGIYDQSTLDIFRRVRNIFEKTYGKNYERTVKVQQAIDALEKEMAKPK